MVTLMFLPCCSDSVLNIGCNACSRMSEERQKITSNIMGDVNERHTTTVSGQMLEISDLERTLIVQSL